MRLNFFFDIDGTIVPFGKPVPQSASDALKWAKSLGHRLFLCTGRAPFEVIESVQSLPFDGGVYSAGAQVVYEGETIFRKALTKEQRDLFFKTVDKYGLLWLNQGVENTYTTTRAVDCIRQMCRKAGVNPVALKSLAIVDEYPADEPMTKILLVSPDGHALEARKALSGVLDSVNNTMGLPQDMVAEMMIPGLTKASGIEILLRHLGEGIETTVGVGDAVNDMEMIDLCEMGIAMGNACDELKQHADFVTADIEDDGLEKAVRHAVETMGRRE